MEQFYQILALASVIGYWLLVAATTIRVVIKRRAVSVSLAWLMIIYILPFVGVICYFLFGELNLGRKRAERTQQMFGPYENWFQQLQQCQAHQPNLIHSQISQIHELCRRRTSIPALCGNSLSLQTTSREILSSIIEDIEAAQHNIRMVFYIWYPGGLADSVNAALMLAAKRGVKVQIAIDSAGSKVFFKSHWPQQMRQAGIELVQALEVSPFRMFFRRLDLRQHRKIITIDDNIAYTGSMNLVDPAFFKKGAGVGEWIDIMVRITGPTVNVLGAIHAWDWEVETGTRILPQIPACSIDRNLAPHPIQVVPSGPGMPDTLIQQVLCTTISQADHSVRITTPYFVPSDILMQVLKTTAQRGVKVELILPKKNDSLLVGWASKSYFTDLLNAGVEIHLFSGGLLHTKSVVIDEQYCLIGTVNLDMRSLWLNFEVTLVVDDEEFTQQLNWLQDSYLKQSQPILLEKWQQRGFMHRFLERIFYLFNPLL